MAGGKGKSIGDKGGAKDAAPAEAKGPKSSSARAGLQVRANAIDCPFMIF